MKPLSLLLCLTVTLALAAGQLLFKKAATSISTATLSAGLLDALRNPYLLGGLLLYALTTGLWVYVLNSVPLGKAYPFTAAAYLIVPLAAHHLFGEVWNLQMLFGSLMIVAGIVAIGSA
ncbi:hypothetical protein [Methylomonas sp. UP202]|uniref:hypothetical protein n=1 Tax=unclassified Methylomonas TaxID=2608980 RepID=UPI002479210D|nr:hypothetical protein [Methylomonas sp. UP202]WGS84687.1 hypothetical protein QC632_16695 [Methylomonas sp. UP202]